MKRLIILELCFIFLATSFPGNAPPPGWFPQVRPVDKVIRDIFFIDSVNGWSVTDGAANPNDTGYIFNTTNAGTNWTIQYKDRISFSSIQFLDKNLGYAIGGSPPNGVMLKTLNGGLNWFTVALINPDNVDDIFFINKDTGWYCSGFLFDGGIYRTINGGVNWQLQRGGLTGTCQLFFLNNDTGWATYGSSSSGSLYRTTNSGMNWNLQYSFPSGLGDVYFFNADNGVV
ncbi:MAG: hypothetical protein IAE65_03930, partial [Ignavibacteria bacterium]|nr:hypothetical protein [Ignavibacteria bacterium]